MKRWLTLWTPELSCVRVALDSHSHSKNAADLTLLLMRAQVPNAEVLNAKTERDLALLAVKHNISLPKHLSHLPTLPPSRTESEKAALVGPTDNWDPMEKTPMKDRPPRKYRLFLRSVSSSLLNKLGGSKKKVTL